MSATVLEQQITAAVLSVKAQLNTAGTTTAATITRQDAAGVWQTIGTADPVYVRQEEPSRLAKALQVAEVLRTTWALYAQVSAAASIQVGDRLTWSAGLVFLVTGLDTTKLPGAIVGTLEKVLTS